MKRIVSILAALILCLSLTLPAFADDGGPFFSRITAYINKSGGAVVYDWGETDDGEFGLLPTKTKIPDKTKITVVGEELEDDDLFYVIMDDDEVEWYLLSTDVSLDLTPVEPEEKNAYDPVKHFVVINPNGAKLYAGPHESYETLKTLPLGTQIQATHGNGFDYGSYPIWSYTTVDGVSGWVHTEQNLECFDFGCPVKYRDIANAPLGEAVVTQEVELHDVLDDYNARTLATIPAGTKLTFDTYYLSEMGYQMYGLVEYQGKEGWVCLRDGYNTYNHTMYNVDGYLCLTEEMALFEDDDLQPGERLSITADPMIVPYDWFFNKALGPVDEWGYLGESDEAYEQWFRVNIEGNNLWLRFGSELGSELIPFSGGWDYELQGSASPTLYLSPDEDSPEIGTIPAGSRYTELFYYDANPDYVYEEEFEESDYSFLNIWHYVRYGDMEGWMHVDYEDFESIPTIGATVVTLGEADDTQEPDEKTEGGIFGKLFGKKDKEGKKAKESKNKTEKDPTTPGVDNPFQSQSPLTTLIGTCAGAVFIVVIAVIGIIRARKK